MSDTARNTIIGALAIAGVGYYIYSTQTQNDKNKRMNPKYNVPLPRMPFPRENWVPKPNMHPKNHLGHGLNSMFSRSSLKTMREHHPRKIGKRRI